MTQNADSPVIPFVTKMVPSYVPVTPEMAARWLDANVVNRRIRESKVIQYASDMAAGRWTHSNDAICFAPDGTLLNGQHRLTAVVRSGATIVMLIIHGMPSHSMATMDAGIARTAADALGFAGEMNSHLLASTARQAIIYTDGRIYQDTKVQAVSHSEILDFVADNPEIRHSVSVIGGIRSHIDAPPTPLALTHWIVAARAGTAVTDHFFHQLAHRTNEPRGSAVLAIDSRLREIKRNRAKVTTRALVYMLVKGWNYYAADKRVSSITLSSKAGTRIPEPSVWKRS